MKMPLLRKIILVMQLQQALWWVGLGEHCQQGRLGTCLPELFGFQVDRVMCLAVDVESHLRRGECQGSKTKGVEQDLYMINISFTSRTLYIVGITKTLDLKNNINAKAV